jgi:hypothetical protein
MTALRSSLRQYIALRRALGTKLQEPAATLERFLDFLEREKAGSSLLNSRSDGPCSHKVYNEPPGRDGWAW